MNLEYATVNSLIAQGFNRSIGFPREFIVSLKGFEQQINQNIN
jgi:hypothetical protein